MPLSICGGVFFLLVGLAAAMLGIWTFHLLHTAVRVSPVNEQEVQLQARAWLAASLLMAAEFACFGLTVLRDSQGTSIVYPVGAPLIAYLLLPLSVVCWGAGFIVLMFHRADNLGRSLTSATTL